MAKSVACDCGRGVSGSSYVERNLQNIKEKVKILNWTENDDVILPRLSQSKIGTKRGLLNRQRS